MAAGTYNFEINQGETFTLGLILTNSVGSAISLTGATVSAQIRPAASSTSILAAITCTPDSGTAGRVVLSLTSAQTAALDPSTFPAVWDCLVTFPSGSSLYPSGGTLRALQGAVTLSAQVTR